VAMRIPWVLLRAIGFYRTGFRCECLDRWPVQTGFWRKWGSPTAGQSVPAARSRRRLSPIGEESSRPVIGVLACGGEISCRKRTKLSERSRTLADDPFRGRHPTSHERMTGLPWDASYHNGPAPWDIGRPQPAIVRLASEGGFVGAVLDAGCGTGENALHIASLRLSEGLPVLGVDVAETALAMARNKARDRGIEVEFVAADAFQLERLGRRFQTVLDCGLFHTFDGEERSRYVASLASVTEHDGTLYVLCFSDDGPETGPHPVSQKNLRAAFTPRTGWNVAAIETERIQTRFHDDGAPAWFATIKRI